MATWNNAWRVLRRTFKYFGRTGRIGFWWWIRFLFGFQLVLFSTVIFPLTVADRSTTDLGTMFIFFLVATFLVVTSGLPATTAVTVRRLHDTNRSGGWLLLWFMLTASSWFVLLRAAYEATGSALWGGDPSNTPIFISLGIALAMTAVVMIWAIWWLNQDGDDGPNRFRDAEL